MDSILGILSQPKWFTVAGLIFNIFGVVMIAIGVVQLRRTILSKAQQVAEALDGLVSEEVVEITSWFVDRLCRSRIVQWGTVLIASGFLMQAYGSFPRPNPIGVATINVGEASTAIAFIALFITLGIAVAAAYTAWVARESVLSANRSRKGELVRAFLEEYGGDKMYAALKKVGRIKKEHPNLLNRKKISFERVPKDVSEARRIVKFYFLKAYKLHDAGLIEKDTLRLIADVAGMDLLVNVIRPIERAITLKPDPDDEIKWIDDLKKLVSEN
ncbi:MAG: hypothetical protein IH994_04000 [Proteobacteria bacterium]|nr:hypothetical protein [Pseudomonadota bacterium]